MIAMQYNIGLPADYDMAIIRRRIADKGHLMDDFPGLAFKAYLYTARDDIESPGRDNLYAPFYLWRDDEGASAFLCGAGFAGLARDFGRPPVRTWLPLFAFTAADLTTATCAMRETVSLPRHAALDELRQAETEWAEDAMAGGALAAVAAFDPTCWKRLRFQLWPDLRVDGAPDNQWYRVGHVSQPRHSH